MAYTDFVKNFLDAIDTFRAVCKNQNVFSQFVQVGSLLYRIVMSIICIIIYRKLNIESNNRISIQNNTGIMYR